MIHCTYHKKPPIKEDPKTSSVFETLLMLPDELVWGILRAACFDNGNLPVVSGLIEDYDFWPNWDSSGTSNPHHVEPDVFIRFQAFDVIIEAKFNDCGGQYCQQWEKESFAYRNEYGAGKPVYFIAVGGNAEKSNEKASLDDDLIVNKCTWLSILIQVTKLKAEYGEMSIIDSHQSSVIRRLKLIELAFKIHGVYNIRWFDEIKTSKPLISPDSILTLKTYFK